MLLETETEMEDTDEIVYIQSNQSHIDVSQLIYETIILSIPSKIEHSGTENDIGQRNDGNIRQIFTTKKNKRS